MTAHWLKDLDPNSYLLPTEIRQGEAIVITVDALASIAEYACSVPTSPSAGRIYRRTHADGTYVFVVQDAPLDDPLGGQLHHPLLALEVP